MVRESTRFMGPFVLLASVVLLSLASATTAWSQACCTSTGSAQFGIVGRCQNAAFSVDIARRQGRGAFGADGIYRSLERAVVSDVVLKVGGGSRLGTDDWQIYGAIPILHQRRDLPGLAPSSTVGWGDASVGVRWTAAHDLLSGIDRNDRSTWRPFLDFYAGTTFPTGRAYEDSEEPSFSDVMGLGSVGLQLGARITKFVTESTVLVADGSWGRRLDRDLRIAGESIHFEPAPEYAVTLEWLELWTPRWSFGGSTSWRWGGAAREDGRRVENSQTRRFAIMGYVTRTLVPMRSELVVAIGGDAWWDQGGRNVPFAGSTLSLGYRRYQF